MGVDSPLLQIGLIVVMGYLFRQWISDFQADRKGNPNPGAFPGATACSTSVVIIGISGAGILVIGETLGESLLGISSEQTSMTMLFALVTLFSGFGEELVFRGYLVITKKGVKVLWLGIFIFSVVFTLAHPHLWTWENASLEFHWTPKAWFSTGVIFLNSLWFYFLRFNRYNSDHSLWPCIAAHVASNAGVFFVKLAQGHVDGLY